MLRVRRTRPRFAISSEADFKRLLDFLFLRRESAVEAALAGLIVLPRDALEIFEETAPTQDANYESTALDLEPLAETLTPRERQVLDMMAEGFGNKEIAWRLQISEHTVKFHVSSILAKLGASSRTEAVTQGLRRGLIMI